LRGPPLSLASFLVLARNREVLLLLQITILSLAAQFTVFVYLGPLLQKLAGVSHQTVGLMFASFGIAGFAGNVVASRIVGRLGGWLTSAIFIGATVAGVALWSLGAGILPAMALGITLMGLGFAATNSMQQARLVQAAPDLSSTSVALNTGSVYVGQALGSWLGGAMYALGMLHGIGYLGVAFAAACMAIWAITRDREGRAA
jgi:DHA1 family inner membrane transport protein